MGSLLYGPFDRGTGRPGGWRIVYELYLGADVLVADWAGWRRERIPTLPDAAFVWLPSDGVCEILSPSTAALDRAKKLTI